MIRQFEIQLSKEYYVAPDKIDHSKVANKDRSKAGRFSVLIHTFNKNVRIEKFKSLIANIKAFKLLFKLSMLKFYQLNVKNMPES